jgi:hypothetical protein
MQRRFLSLTLLTLGFILGCFVTVQAQGGSVHFPYIAKAAAVPPTVKVVNVHYDSGRQRFLGEALNQTPYTVYFGPVTVYLLDAGGLPVGSVMGYSEDYVLPPGGRMPFSTSSGGSVPPWSPFTANVAWIPIGSLDVVSKELTQDRDSWTVTASLRNQFSIPLHSPKVIAVLYGASGEVIGKDQTYTVPQTVQPGETFVALVRFGSWGASWDTSVEPASCGVFGIPR